MKRVRSNKVGCDLICINGARDDLRTVNNRCYGILYGLGTQTSPGRFACVGCHGRIILCQRLCLNSTPHQRKSRIILRPCYCPPGCFRCCSGRRVNRVSALSDPNFILRWGHKPRFRCRNSLFINRLHPRLRVAIRSAHCRIFPAQALVIGPVLIGTVADDVFNLLCYCICPGRIVRVWNRNFIVIVITHRCRKPIHSLILQPFPDVCVIRHRRDRCIPVVSNPIAAAERIRSTQPIFLCGGHACHRIRPHRRAQMIRADRPRRDPGRVNGARGNMPAVDHRHRVVPQGICAGARPGRQIRVDGHRSIILCRRLCLCGHPNHGVRRPIGGPLLCPGGRCHQGTIAPFDE